jgi:hypothetical protein
MSGFIPSALIVSENMLFNIDGGSICGTTHPKEVIIGNQLAWQP